MNDPDDILLDPKFRKEQLLLEAGWRFQLVAPLLSDDLDGAAKVRLRKRLTTEKHPHPFRGEISVSARTLRRWCRSYRDKQLAGLWMQLRADVGRSRAVPLEAFEEAKRLFREDPRRTVTMLIRLLATLNPDWAGLKRTTLGRHLRAAGMRRAAREVQSYLKFEAIEPNQRWQGDVLHGPKVLAGEKLVTAKVVSWIDDYSRLVVHLEAFDNERLPVLEHTLTRAIAKHGKPRTLLVDNGKIYSSTAFTLACSQLGIHKVHSSPYHPESKGKQERFFRTLREQLLNEVENVEPISLERFNGLLRSWLDAYHRKKHSETQAAPSDRYAKVLILPIDRELLEEAFLQWTRRKVSVQGAIDFGGQRYFVDPSLAGKPVIVRYNAFDLSRIWLWHDGRKLCCATPEALINKTYERRTKPLPDSASSASERYLQGLENGLKLRLEQELNLMRLEDPAGE